MSSSDPSTDNKASESTPVITNEAENKTDSKKITSQKSDKKKSSNAGSYILLLFILVLLGIGGAGYFYWNKLQTTLSVLQTENQQQLTHLTELSTKLENAQAQFQQQKLTLTQLTAQLTDQQKVIELVDKSQQTLIQTTKNVFDISHRDQRQWLLAEVSYLLSVANQRLLIARDIKTATAALKAANNRLHDLADPSLLKLRKKIAKEITQLNLLKLPDINGIAFTLDNLSPLITLLPFKTAKQKTLDSTQQSKTIELVSLDDQSFFFPLWERIKSLVTVKKHSRDILQTETPLEKNQIDNQIRYRIETSRLALINKNTTVFNYEIKSARELLELYYNQNDNRVAGLFKELKPLTTIDLLPELPDVTGSWVLLQQIIAISDINNTATDINNSKGKSIK